MMSIIPFINSVIFSLAYMIVIKNYIKNNIKEQFFLFCTIFLFDVGMNVVFIQYTNFASYVSILIATYAINMRQKNVIRSLNISVAGLCFLQVFVIIAGSCINYLMPIANIATNVIYNIVMQISILGFSFLIKKKDLIVQISPKYKETLILGLTYNILFFMFLNYIMSYLYHHIGLELYCLVSITFIVFDLLSKVILMVMNKKDSDLMAKELELRMLKDKSDILKNKHTEILRIKGFTKDLTNEIYNHLKKQDINSLMSYINEKVYPTYLLFISDTSNIREINQIKDPFIKEIITDFCHRISEKKEIEITFSILYNTLISEKNQLETYECIQTFLHNNYNELMHSDRDGHKIIHIHISNTDKKFTFFTYCSSDPQNEHISEAFSRRNQLRQFFQKKPQNINLRVLRDSVFFCQQVEVRQ